MHQAHLRSSLEPLPCPRDMGLSVQIVYLSPGCNKETSQLYRVYLSSLHSSNIARRLCVNRSWATIYASYYERREMDPSTTAQQEALPSSSCQTTTTQKPTYYTCSSQGSVKPQMHITSLSTCTNHHRLPVPARHPCWHHGHTFCHRMQQIHPEYGHIRSDHIVRIFTTMEVVKVAEIPHSLQLDTDQENITNCKIVKLPRNSHTAGNPNWSTRRFQGKIMHILLCYPKQVRPLILVCIKVISDLGYVIV